MKLNPGMTSFLSKAMVVAVIAIVQAGSGGDKPPGRPGRFDPAASPIKIEFLGVQSVVLARGAFNGGPNAPKGDITANHKAFNGGPGGPGGSDGPACVDIEEEYKCVKWAQMGECTNNAAFMLPSCAKSCGECVSTDVRADESGSFTSSQIPVNGIDFNVETTCTATSRTETCFDNYDYIGNDGYSCPAWRADDCDFAQNVTDVKLNCPAACGLCTPEHCKDNIYYVDPYGSSCVDWEGFECSTASETYGFSTLEETLLLKNCKKSCKFCGDWSDDSCQFPFMDNNGTRQTRCVYDAADGSEWCKTKKATNGNNATKETAWKICIPDGTRCQFPFIFNKTTYNSCVVDPHTESAWCPTKLNWDGTPWNGHWATCECDAAKDAVYVSRTTTTTTSTSTAVCDDAHNFKDADGEGCDVYVEKRYCNADGSPGKHWMQGETFADYKNNHGLHAGTACCGCGGGRTRPADQ